MLKREKRKQELYDAHTQIELEEEWAKYKYWIMARSQQAYNELRVMFRDTVQIDKFYQIIDEHDIGSEDKKAEVNAFQHVWGYFKKEASDNEKQQFKALLAYYRKEDSLDKVELYKFLYDLSLKYQKTYLLNSYYFEEVED